jgi:NitT/TauT family transport system substrate-binding protein
VRLIARSGRRRIDGQGENGGLVMQAVGRGLRLFAVGVLAVVMVACSVTLPGAKPAALDLRIGLIPATASAPILVPADAGEYAAKGLNVSIQPVTDTGQAMISVASGQFDMGNITLGSAALNAFSRGTDLKIIAAGGAEPPGHGANLPVIVRTELIDSGAVKTVADLKGRKVAINGRGVIIEYALAKALATVGLQPSDVDVVILPFPEMLAALTTGAIDAGLLLQPIGAQAVSKGIGKILVDDYNQNAQNAVVVVNSRFLDQHRDAVTSFLEVYIQAIRRLSDGKLKSDDQALAALQKYTNTPPDIIKLGPDPYWPKDGRVLLDSVADEQQFFMANKSTDYQQPLDLQKLVDYGPLNDALQRIGNG